MHTAQTREQRLARQQRILALVREHSVQSQRELAELLAEGGLEANQATLSRDLRELGLVKTPQGYRSAEQAAPTAQADLDRALRRHLRQVQAVQHQVLLHTPVGSAQPLAFALDHTPLDGVLGTLAGDDTILIICPDKKTALQVADDLQQRAAAGGA